MPKPAKPPDGVHAGEAERRLLAIVGQLASELRPGARHVEPALGSDLDRDLGFDSLSRVELLMRVGSEFRVTLPDQLVGAAQTPADLLRAVLAADRSGAPARLRDIDSAAVGGGLHAPDAAGTLLDVMAWHATHQADRVHVLLYETGDGPPVELAYGALAAGAARVAGNLVARGLAPGQTVAIMLPTGRDYLECFLGILRAGGVPVPIYPPARPSQLEDHLRRHARILENARTALLVTLPEGRRVGGMLRALVPELGSILVPADLASDAPPPPEPAIGPDDLALLQYTSGSTGQPKGVMLTHGQLLANIRAMEQVIGVREDDVFVSWLPMYHDMGLIGAWLGSLYAAMPLVLMSPLAFLSRPQRWLWALHRHRGTLTAAPNFAYELCMSRIPDAELEGLDLSRLRWACNGAEPVSAHAVRGFCERFSRYGLSPSAVAPVYGLAECAVGLAFPPPGRPPLIDRIRRAPMESGGEAQPATAQDSEAMEIVACGRPLPGYEIRIVDGSGRELPDRREGRLEFRGPSATRGYMRNPEATRALFDGDWLDSGDLAYIADGDIFLTGRVKDVIIRGGRNLYPYEVETAAGELAGVRKGCVAMFGARDPRTGTERVIIVAETREQDDAARDALQQRIRDLATGLLGMPPDDVVLAPPHTVLKTSSGKIRRSACRELYEKGRLTTARPGVLWQLVRLAVSSAAPRWRRLRRSTADLAWAIRAQTVFWLVAPAAWTAVLLTPGADRRWRLLRAFARTMFHLAGIRITAKGTGVLAGDAPCVVVANHASYLDGAVLVACIPRPLTFVAKAELRDRFVSRVFLTRIGAAFVERFDADRSVDDSRQLAARAGSGRALCYFPEGTFTRAPGLQSFRMGAFVAAAGAGIAVVPVALRGTRSVLRSDTWFPRAAPVTVIVEQALVPAGSDWNAALALRDGAREAILRHLGEPDLGAG